ncbi:hypothetical protein CLAFUW4_09206 [Fulvia fulva]|nr:hypothetical protein CLAFUR4_09212 [Fulvia fulva]KAK4614487.1 hypothetical protein CLAFUR0_09204 [Fulvia fulva]WPV20670.1 hypothetical protein CLAFUW4_09206 [Fulvia fulva]WPV35267.1 hypothetical protein CLAFUW7_09207 [Fulvia fulva]
MAMAKPVVMNMPFLDLPAEMRNRIYDSALTHNRRHGQSAAVALLRTCKQVHQEGVGILQARSNFTIDVKFKVSARSYHVTASGDMIWSLEDPSIITLASNLPREVLKPNIVCVKIALSRTKSMRLSYVTRTDYAAVNRFPYALVQHLNSDHKLRGLVLELEDGRIMRKLNKEPDDFAEIFWPLSILRTNVLVRYLGFEHTVLSSMQPQLDERPTPSKTPNNMIAVHQVLGGLHQEANKYSKKKSTSKYTGEEFGVDDPEIDQAYSRRRSHALGTLEILELRGFLFITESIEGVVQHNLEKVQRTDPRWYME